MTEAEFEKSIECLTVSYTCHRCKIDLNEVENQDEVVTILYKLCITKEQI